MSEREHQAVRRVEGWVKQYGRYPHGLDKQDLDILLELAKRHLEVKTSIENLTATMGEDGDE